MNDEEKVSADEEIPIPEKRRYQIRDALTRQDELLEAILKVLGSINEKTRPPAISKEEYKKIAEKAIEKIEIEPEIEIPPEIADRISRAMERVSFEPLISIFEEYKEGMPVVELDSYEGGSQSWKEVVKWEVGEEWGGKKGGWDQISITSNDYDKAELKLFVKSKDLFASKKIPSATTIPAPNNLNLVKGDKIILSARSTDGTAIRVDAILVGKEWE